LKAIRFAVTHPVTIWMATVAAVVFGLVALGRLDMRLLPEIRYPSVTIQTEFPNTAPVDVENLVTRPLEEAVGVVPGLRKVHSISQSGMSQITLEFGWNTDMDYAGLDVREKIDLIQLPDESRPPILLKYDPALDPVLRVGLWGDMPLVNLRNIAEDVLKRDIESLEGVAAAKVAGGLEEEIQVEVDEARLSSLGIPIASVNQALLMENINASGGRLRDRNAEYIVRTLSRFENLNDIEEVTVATVGGRPVKLREVAKVYRTHRERTTITHVDGRESVEIAIYKEGDENIVELAGRVRAHLDSMDDRLPDAVNMEVLFDQSVFIARAVDEVRNNAFIGGLLAILVLYVFLRDFRSTLIIGVSIPISIIATFILMYMRGVSLNVMSLGGLALGVGMLVDNSIVVLEAIHRKRESARNGESEEMLTVQGASEVGTAVIASTLTTVAVFVPIVFVVVGVAGQIFRDQALTVTFSLFISLLVALTFTPMAMVFGRRVRSSVMPALATPDETGKRSRFGFWKGYLAGYTGFRRWVRLVGLFIVLLIPVVLSWAVSMIVKGLRWLLTKLLAPLGWLFEKIYPWLASTYMSILVSALTRRGLVLLVVIAMAAGAVALFPTLGTELIPPLSQGEFTLALELPEGTPLSGTEREVLSIERELAEVAGITLQAASVGVSHDGETSAQRRKENRAEIHVKLDQATKEREVFVLEGIRRVLAKHPDVSMKLRRQSLFTFNAPIEVDVYGYNLEDLQATSYKVAEELESIDGLRDVKLGMVPGSPEVRVSFDRDKLNRFGLSLADVSETVRGKVRGTVSGQIRDREKHIDIRVMNREEQRNTLAAVKDLIVAERGGVQIPLSSIASMEVARGPSEIHRLGRKRVVIVSANLTGRDLGSVSEEIRIRLAGLGLPANISVALGGQNDEMENSFRSLQMAILLAIFLVYLVMAAQFESFLYPLIIMITVPLALMGAVYGLKLTGTPLSVIAVIGAIMLAGIVVNNGIVLVDRINQLRRKQGLYESVLQAGQERFRPIIMTTSTTVLGLLPMALGLGEGAELRAPLAITVISGLLLATLLTLVVVPVIYTLITPGGQTDPVMKRRKTSAAVKPSAAPVGGEA
jgi:hydrophobic/amphiphilic exporter-1 (mainly G- bacteria), HAE1 family